MRTLSAKKVNLSRIKRTISADWFGLTPIGPAQVNGRIAAYGWFLSDQDEKVIEIMGAVKALA